MNLYLVLRCPVLQTFFSQELENKPVFAANGVLPWRVPCYKGSGYRGSRNTSMGPKCWALSSRFMQQGLHKSAVSSERRRIEGQLRGGVWGEECHLYVFIVSVIE